MSRATAKDDAHPAVKGPSALRSIIAGSTAGAVEIGERHLVRFAGQPLTRFLDSNYIPGRMYVALRPHDIQN
jgi:hypothetical protein